MGSFSPLLVVLVISACRSTVLSLHLGDSSKWAEANIVPGFIHAAPANPAHVTFGTLEITLGQMVSPKLVESQPTVQWESDPNSFYTLLMIDVKHPEFLHWIVGNIPGSNLSMGEVLTEFVPSIPPMGSGVHKIAFLVYRQPRPLNFYGFRRLSALTMVPRRRFSTRQFAHRFHLMLVAGTFYLTQFEVDSETSAPNNLTSAQPTSQEGQGGQIQTEGVYGTSITAASTSAPLRMDGYMPQMVGKSVWFSSGIVPDAILSPPKSTLLIYFDGIPVLLGNELTPTMVRNKPSFHWNADPHAFYTLIMMDLDAVRPNNEKFQFLHWLVGNIPGFDVEKGEALAAFISSGPRKGSGLHRYVFLVFRQYGFYGFEGFARLGNTSPAGRNVSTINELARKFRFTELTAGNFYRAQYDNYSDVVMRNLGGTP